MVKTKKKDAKFFIGYKNDKFIRPLFNKFLQMAGFLNEF